jgi:transposase
MMRTEQPCEFICVDISERCLDTHVLPEEVATGSAQDAGRIGRLLTWLGARAVTLVVVEATGGIARRLVVGLQRAKVLATFAERMPPRPALVRSISQQRLAGPQRRPAHRRPLVGRVDCSIDQRQESC